MRNVNHFIFSRLFPGITVLLFLLTGSSHAQDGGAGRIIKTGTITVARETLPLTVTLSGQAVAEKNAAIRPLVGGVITDILYEAGRKVDKGAPLFQIEKESYIATLDVAKAALESAKAAVPSASENLKRYEKLSGTGVSKSEVDTARTQLQQAQAAVRSAEADLKTAEINLRRTTITSPIAGIAATADISVGDLVTAGQSDTLTTVMQLDPILVDLAETSSRLLDVRKRVDAGDINQGDSIHAVLILENGDEYKGEGVILSIGNKVSTSTGTLTVRVRFKNPDHLILPGMFLRAKLTLGTLDGFLIPQLAAEPQADSTIGVWTLNKDSKAKQIFLVPEGSTDTSWIIPHGLEDGTVILVDNTDNLRDGASVEPVPVEIDENGVIHDIVNNSSAGKEIK